jgi:hypothetical protein
MSDPPLLDSSRMKPALLDSSRIDNSRMKHVEKRWQPSAPDFAGDELFSHSRRARNYMPPTILDPPFDRDQSASMDFRQAFRSPRVESNPGRPSSPTRNSPRVHGSDQSPRPYYPIDSSWRASDDTPFSIDGSPRARVNPLSTSKVRDPELKDGWANPNGIHSGCASACGLDLVASGVVHRIPSPRAVHSQECTRTHPTRTEQVSMCDA